MGRDLPIIFSVPMVRALLEGRKTMTRRLAWSTRNTLVGGAGAEGRKGVPSDVRSTWTKAQPGDRLWVRESLQRSPERHWRYAADGTVIVMPRTDPRVTAMVAWAHHKEGDHAPSIHMPRWASRITLIVTAVKTEKLQDITEADALAEGARVMGAFYGFGYPTSPIGKYPQSAFAGLWSELHGATSWDENPEVVAISFTPFKSNIDALTKTEAA